MILLQDVIKIAEEQIGYIEKKTNSNLDSKTANAGSNNYTKFGRDLHNAGYYNGNKNGYAWCDQFVDWCFYQASGKNKKAAEAAQCQTGPYGAGCGYSMQYYKDAGRFDKNPKKGDQIFFRYKGTTSGADHTGLVIDVTADKIITIEGNSGDRVQKHTYSRSDSTIYGYGHPKYDTAPAVKEAQYSAIDMPTIKQGDSGHCVKVVQRLLRCMEYLGEDGNIVKIDGDFGANTTCAVRSYQRRNGLTVSGIVDGKTWKMFLRGI